MRDLLRFMGIAGAVFVTTHHAAASDRSGFGLYRNVVTESPKLDCSPYNADSSPGGWVCDPDPDRRGLVVSTRVGDQCIPTRVSMNYYYTTNNGVRKSIPSALTYQCKDGALDGSFEQRHVVLAGPTDTREDTIIERGKYAGGKATGVWTLSGVSAGGLATLHSETYEKGEVVGVSRTTEGGKLIEVECSSRIPTHPSRFWDVKLEKATPEKIALAERAALACADWSTATCENFKGQGLFEKELNCQCDAQCSHRGACALEHGQCVEPRSEEDCGKSAACLSRGLCGFDGKTCVVTGDDDCLHSLGCAENGLCTRKKGECIATDEGCAASVACKADNRCHAFSARCVVEEIRSSSPATYSVDARADGPQGSSMQTDEEQNDKPIVPMKRRSPGLYGLGIAATAVGGAAVLGGIVGFMYYKQITGEETTTLQKVGFTGTGLLGLGMMAFVGVPLMRVYGERVPVTSPKAAKVTIRPQIGPTWIGVQGQF